MSTSAALVLREGDRQRLGDLVRPTGVPSDLARRARIVLLAADGMPNAEIARIVGVSRPTVIGWRERYAQGGIERLEDEPRPGRPRVIDEIDVVIATLADGGRPPAQLGLTHWSVRSLAGELGISFASVARIWRRWGIRPDEIKAFSFRTEPRLEFRPGEIVGMFLDPPTTVVVFSADEILTEVPQEPDQQPGQSRADESDVVAALVMALTVVGHQTGQGRSGGVRQPPDLLAFLDETVASRPGRPVRAVADHLGALLGSAEQSLLGDNPWISLHAATADCAWLALVGVLLGVTAGPESGKEAVSAVRRFTDANDGRSGPFTWINHSVLLADL